MKVTTKEKASYIQHTDISPHTKELEGLTRGVLENAIHAEQRGEKVYQSLKNLSEVIGTQYGNRVLFELIQNAHDAHSTGDNGKIAVYLKVDSENQGTLYIANGGRGFRSEDVEAIRNLAMSGKEIGDGIGNKGLGFRSIEALTDDVQIYSCASIASSERFNGYCFRFARTREIQERIECLKVDASTAKKVAASIPRYLVPLPLHEQPVEITNYARCGYATVIVVPLQSAEAVNLARKQVEALSNIEVPLLLFLDRIVDVQIGVEIEDQSPIHLKLARQQTDATEVSGVAGCTLSYIDLGKKQRFLLVQQKVDKSAVLKAVTASIPRAPQLRRWRAWKGQPVVAIAVGLAKSTVKEGRLFNFLPMGEAAVSPFIGYLDAPFFADIDRRNIDLELPLNSMFISTAAKACAATALSLIKHGSTISQHAIFDLVSWVGEEADKLDQAFEDLKTHLSEAPFVPILPIPDRDGWSSIGDAYFWPKGKFSVMKASEMARKIGAQLVSDALDDRRITRLEKIAARDYLNLNLNRDPTLLAKWCEKFAQALAKRNATPRSWSNFYEDLYLLFEETDTCLAELAEFPILYVQSGKSGKVLGRGKSSTPKVFVSGHIAKGQRRINGLPLPPSSLKRRYRFLFKEIKLSTKTLDAFIAADLLWEYDPVEALRALGAVLGENTNDARRKEALLWAFKIWQVVDSKIEDELKEANLYVPVCAGWRPAKEAVFSSSWTSIGKKLENYLIEASLSSNDCKEASGYLLAHKKDWPDSGKSSKKEWVQFLEVIGVADGLKPISSHTPDRGTPASCWNSFTQTPNISEGLDESWCK
jgi:hypothetical protein